MMLAAVPGQKGDGSPMTLDYTLADGSVLPVTTFVGAKPGADKLKRFLVGPVDSEITGVAETPDGARCSSISSTRARRWRAPRT